MEACFLSDDDCRGEEMCAAFDDFLHLFDFDFLLQPLKAACVPTR